MIFPDDDRKAFDSILNTRELLEMRNGWSEVNEQLVFHGTTRSCSLGEEEQDINLCEKITCSLCCILRTSFLVSKAGSVERGFNRCVEVAAVLGTEAIDNHAYS